MATWTVLSRALPGDTGTDVEERVVFVREKFSWATLFLAPLVLLRYRLWLVFAAYVAVSLILGFAVLRAGLPSAVADVVMTGFHVLLALELPALRVRKLARGGYVEEGVVIAQDMEEAEQRFFAQWVDQRAVAQRPVPRPLASPVPGAAAVAPGVIGSFPGIGNP